MQNFCEMPLSLLPLRSIATVIIAVNTNLTSEMWSNTLEKGYLGCYPWYGLLRYVGLGTAGKARILDCLKCLQLIDSTRLAHSI